jgi:hypothetical protein
VDSAAEELSTIFKLGVIAKKSTYNAVITYNYAPKDLCAIPDEASLSDACILADKALMFDNGVLTERNAGRNNGVCTDENTRFNIDKLAD